MISKICRWIYPWMSEKLQFPKILQTQKIQKMASFYNCLHLQSITADFRLSLPWRRSLSYRNQSIDLLCKPMDWFQYDRDLRHERINSFAANVSISYPLKTPENLWSSWTQDVNWTYIRHIKWNKMETLGRNRLNIFHIADLTCKYMSWWIANKVCYFFCRSKTDAGSINSVTDYQLYK